LLPRLFSDVHPKFRTPWRSNVLLMIFVSFFSALTPIATLGEMTSIGTLTAFILVCAGIIILRKKRPELPRPFKTPWVPLVPILGIIFNLLLILSLSPLNWLRFAIWLLIGLVVFFKYSRYHSKLTAGADR
jgi:APA family basic amino acid/polyamine antiporter